MICMLSHYDTMAKGPRTDKHANKNAPEIRQMRSDGQKGWSVDCFRIVIKCLSISEAVAELLVVF